MKNLDDPLTFHDLIGECWLASVVDLKIALQSSLPSVDAHPMMDDPSQLLYEIHVEGSDRSSWSGDISAFYEYWLGLWPDQKQLPGRQHIDPTAIPKLLPYVWLIDVHRSPTRYRVRLLGTQIVRVLDRDLTGKWLDESYEASKQLDAILQRFELMTTRRVVTYRARSRSLFFDKDHILVENILVPLARDGVTVDMLAGLSIITGLNGRRVAA